MSLLDEPAFPTVKTREIRDRYNNEFRGSNVYSEGGLTKREYMAIEFATKSFGELKRNDAYSVNGCLREEHINDANMIASSALRYADALLAELSKTEGAK